MPLAERLHRRDPDLASSIYSDAVLTFLRDGVVILLGAIDLVAFDQLDHDLQTLSRNETDVLLGSVEIDGPEKYFAPAICAIYPSMTFARSPLA